MDKNKMANAIKKIFMSSDCLSTQAIERKDVKLRGALDMYRSTIKLPNFFSSEGMNFMLQNFCKLTKNRWLSYNQNYSGELKTLAAEKLLNRNLIKISGENCSTYLQGLITNDVRHLEDNSSIYAMFLNSKGRVLYDTIVYKSNHRNTLYLECDITITDALVKHLTMYRVRRKIFIENCESDFNVWTLCNFRYLQNIHVPEYLIKTEMALIQTGGRHSDYENIGPEVLDCIVGDNVIVSRDPRMPYLGYRIICPKTFDLINELNSKRVYKVKEEPFSNLLRYRLGVGEGVIDLPPGNCFPLEANCDYLHGISFHKGCYIGQELTARTYHTGVIRKRLMPVYLEESIEALEPNLPVKSAKETDKSLGKLRNVTKQFGLALLRIEEALQAPALQIHGIVARTIKPFWWPSEAPKERQNTGQ